MSKKEIAITVNNVSKSFKLPHQKTKSVKSIFLNVFNRKTYENQKALTNISFDIKKGEFFGIVGRNGGGKSTLLKLISGIYEPSKGTILVNGKLTPFIELGVGFNPELTGKENVYLNGALLGFDTKQVDVMYDEIVRFAELERFMDQKLNNYSSGMQVRLAFSIAVQSRSDILVFDEVLAVGDSNFQQKCLREFRRLKEEGKTIVLVTHSMEYIEKFCDRAIMIDKGLVVKEGKPSDIAFEYSKINTDGSEVVLQSNETGNRKVVVDKIELLGLSTKKVIEPGDDLEILIKYSKNDDSIKTINSAVGIYNQDGVYVIGVDTSLDKKGPFLAKKSGIITLKFYNLQLLTGDYKLNVALYEDDRESPLHFLRQIESFTIIDRNNNRGILKTKHEWRTDG